MAYTFLTLESDKENGVEKYYAISSEKIETLKVSDTYDGSGQCVTHEDAGDHLTLISQAAVDAANTAYSEYLYGRGEDEPETPKWSIGDVVSAYSDGNEFDAVNGNLNEGDDFQLFAVECKGFNYWDGSNWKSIIVSCDVFEYQDAEILDDKELIEKLNLAIDNKEYKSEGFGRKYYTYEDVTIEDNYCQGTWASYILTIE